MNVRDESTEWNEVLTATACEKNRMEWKQKAKMKL